MKQPDSVELGSTDLAMWLSRLACRLRNDGLALVGRASLESSPGKQDYEEITELWNSLERTASLMEAIQGRLCEGCRTLEVSERGTFGAVPEARAQSPKKEGKGMSKKKGKAGNRASREGPPSLRRRSRRRPKRADQDARLNTVERKHEGLEREHNLLPREHRVHHGRGSQQT